MKFLQTTGKTRTRTEQLAGTQTVLHVFVLLSNGTIWSSFQHIMHKWITLHISSTFAKHMPKFSTEFTTDQLEMNFNIIWSMHSVVNLYSAFEGDAGVHESALTSSQQCTLTIYRIWVSHVQQQCLSNSWVISLI